MCNRGVPAPQICAERLKFVIGKELARVTKVCILLLVMFMMCTHVLEM